MASAAQADCRSDALEIGDHGPDSEIVCEFLAREFPGTDIQLLNRKILETNRVILKAEIDNKPYSIDYRLLPADWIKSHEPCLALRQESLYVNLCSHRFLFATNTDLSVKAIN